VWLKTTCNAKQSTRGEGTPPALGQQRRGALTQGDPNSSTIGDQGERRDHTCIREVNRGVRYAQEKPE